MVIFAFWWGLFCARICHRDLPRRTQRGGKGATERRSAEATKRRRDGGTEGTEGRRDGGAVGSGMGVGEEVDEGGEAEEAGVDGVEDEVGGGGEVDEVGVVEGGGGLGLRKG